MIRYDAAEMLRNIVRRGPFTWSALTSSKSIVRVNHHSHHWYRRSSSSAALRKSGEAEASSSTQAAIIDDKIVVSWPDGRRSSFDHEYLMDHCRCPKCFHAGTKQRLKSLFEFSPDVRARSVEASDNGVKIAWSPQHISLYPLSFLKKASYDPKFAHEANFERILWNSRIGQSPPEIHHDILMSTTTTDTAVLRLLDQVHQFGFCFIQGVPATPEASEAVIRRIGPIRETHYGKFWDFTADMSHGDLAYSSLALPAHTDTTYFSDPAGLQIFHLLSHPAPGTGGTTLLVDAFHTASLLLTLHPTAYSTLSRLRIPCHASGTRGTLLRPVISQPVFRHDETGQLAQVRWNNEDRGVLGRGWRPEDVREWYKAARRFEELCRSEDAEYRVQLAPGTMVVIDNWRVMHGRSAFTGARRMCGAYIGADDWRSRRAALKHGELSEWDVGW